MNRYAVLINPFHNRVYFESALKLYMSEFEIVSRGMSSAPHETECQNISGIEYLTFTTVNELSSSDIKIISHLSFAYAFFLIEKINGDIWFKPIKKEKEEYVDESISSILKYTGKTNEIFTRMMINIASSVYESDENIRLLDPLAGKGTTIYEGLIRGFDVYGIEVSDNVVSESSTFLRKFLETAKYKFNNSSIKISGPNRSFTALRHNFEIARTKTELKNKDFKKVEFIAGNSMYADKFYKREFFDIIVSDLPYGIQHGNVTKEKQSTKTRNPSELLEICLPSWANVLKHDGVIVLSWNTNVLSRTKMEQIFLNKGFRVKEDSVYKEFEHRVDQSIVRDIIVAIKP